MFYKFVRFIARILTCFIFRINVRGIEDFPDEGAVILYSNHKSNWDPVIICSLLKRPVFFMAKQELFKIPVLGILIRKVNAFPVKRGTPDRMALKKALELLDTGKVLGIFPEGTRSRNRIVEPEPGLAFIAMKRKNAKLVPVAIKGDYGLFSRIDVIFGKPKTYESYNGEDKRVNSQRLKEISAEIFSEVSRLM